MRRFSVSVSFIVSLFIVSSAFAIETNAKQAIVIDDTTNTILFEKDANVQMHPSSMSKLMTAYIIFKRLHDGSLKLSDTMPVSEKAWRTQGSKMFVELGARISVEDLIKGIIIQSGNDACVVMAEGLAGSEDAFAELMNETAKQLGLTNSHFTNATGLPDDKHLMSARDLAILSQHIIHDFPEYYHYFSQKDFVYHGINQGNRNTLLYKNIGVDGLKTGHTDAGGYGEVVSGTSPDGKHRIILVVNGLSSMKERAEESERLFDFGLRDFDAITLLHQGEILDSANVWFGQSEKVGLTVDKDAIITLPKVGRDRVKFTLVYNDPIAAPIEKGAHIADLKILFPDTPVKTIPLTAAQGVDELHGFSRVLRVLHYYVSGQ